MAITKNTGLKTEQTKAEMMQVLMNQYIKYNAMSKALIDESIFTEEQITKFENKVKKEIAKEAIKYSNIVSPKLEEEEVDIFAELG